MLQKIKVFLATNHFVKNASILMSGTAGAQLIILLASPIITRLYDPSVFGEFSAFIGILSIFVVISTLRFHLAIPIANSEIEAIQLVVISIVSLIIITLFAFLLILISPLPKYLNSIVENDYAVWLLPLGIFFVGLFQISNYWGIRQKIFKDIASTRLVQSVLLVFIQISASAFGVLALIIGQIVGQAAGVYRLFKKGQFKSHYRYIDKREVINTAKRYKKLPLFESWSALLNAAGYHFPVVIFAMFFNATSAGLYALANQMLSIPVALLGEAVGKVFISDLSAKLKKGLAKAYIYEVIENLAKFCAPLFVLFALFSVDLFTIVFGDKWGDAGFYAVLMSPWLYIVFIVSPITGSLILANKQEFTLYFQCSLMFFRIISISIGVYFDHVVLAIILYAFASASVWIIYLLAICRVFEIPLLKVCSTITAPVFLFLLIITPFIVSNYIVGLTLLNNMSFLLIALATFFYYRKLIKSRVLKQKREMV